MQGKNSGSGHCTIVAESRVENSWEYCIGHPLTLGWENTKLGCRVDRRPYSDSAGNIDLSNLSMM